MRVTVLAGGIGAARFLLGLRRLLGSDQPTVVCNTGDDITLFGLRVCPDLDSVMYTLGGVADPGRGWGRAGETFVVREELAGYAPDQAWFGLGDRDLATHLVRTGWLAGGLPLSTVTARLCDRWRPGVRLLPMTDDPVETHVQLTDGRSIHFQEWWVRHHATVPAAGFELSGGAAARPAPGVVAAIDDCDAVLLAPSNPVVSIGPILSVPGIRAALAATAAPVVGVSPIVGGAPVRGMADACLAAIGVETSAAAVARHYGRRDAGGVLDGWLVDERDGADADALRADGFRVRRRPLLMTDEDATVAIAAEALELAATASAST